MFNSGFFSTFIVVPILNVLIGLYKLFLLIHLPGALGFALIVLTVLMRLLLHPFTKKQLESTHKLNKLKPQLDQITKIYKDDKTRLHQEQLRLYKEAGINPAAGCLPLVIQLPVLIGLYNLFFSILSAPDIGKVAEDINKVVYFSWLKIQTLDLSFFGVNLAHKPNEWQKIGWWLLLVPVITAVLQYWQTKQMIPSAPATASTDKKSQPGPKANQPLVEKANQPLAVTVDKDGKKDEKKDEDMGAAMQKQMAIMMPLMIGFFAYSFPLGLALYWNTFTIFGIIQQYQMSKK